MALKMVNLQIVLAVQDQGSQHFKKTKFPDFSLMSFQKFQDNYFDLFPV